MKRVKRHFSARWLVGFCLLGIPLTLFAQSLDSVLASYRGTPEQNAFLWRNLEALRARPKVPPHVVQGLNTYRVAAVRSAREAVVREMAQAGMIDSKALAGFINTGTWNDPKKFQLKSDVDFTAVGRDPATVKEFQKRFYQRLGNEVGVPPGRVIKTLDVNCYSLGGTEPGAYRTPGGRRFFEVYSAKTGGYESITGRGANASVVRSHIDNAFYDLGKKTPRFTPAESAMFAGELRNQMRANAGAFRGALSQEAKANAKLVERIAYADAVAQGQVLGEGAVSQVVREANALRAGQPVEKALAGRIEQLMRTGMSREKAMQAATRQFVNDTRNYVEHTTARLGNAAVKAEEAQVAKTEGMLAKLSGGKLAAGALRAGAAALTLYFLHEAAKQGKEALAKEIVKQGIFHAFPATALGELAGVAVDAGGHAILDCANEYKANAALSSMFGGTPEGMMQFYKNYRDPRKLRAFIEKEWKEQDQFSGAYYGKGVSNEEVRELIFDQARAMMLEITSRLREEKQREQRIVRLVREKLLEDRIKERLEEEDRELTKEIRELQDEELRGRHREELARLEAEKQVAEEEAEKAAAAEEGYGGRVVRAFRKLWREREAEEEKNKETAKAENEAEAEQAEQEEQQPATATPNLVRTRWTGTVAMQEVSDQTVGGNIVLPIEFTIDSANRITGRCRFPAVAGMGFADDPGLREVPLEGRYNSRTGRLELTINHRQDSKPIGEMAGVPIVEESRLTGRVTGAAESGDVITGDIRAAITVSHVPGRAYTQEEIDRWAAGWWRTNRPSDPATQANIADTARRALEVLSQRDPYDEPLTATFRAERQP